VFETEEQTQVISCLPRHPKSGVVAIFAEGARLLIDIPKTTLRVGGKEIDFALYAPQTHRYTQLELDVGGVLRYGFVGCKTCNHIVLLPHTNYGILALWS